MTMMTQEKGSARTGRLPDFIIIGAMKAGTTTLYELLARHPRIAVSSVKEPMFFSRDHAYARGLDWYRSLFAHAQDDQICGEASTCYSRWPHFADVPARIGELMPQVKLMYIMRHPVERAYSHYAHDMRRGVTMTFEQAIEQDQSIIDAGLYIRQIERYLRVFPREQMLLLTLDDLRADPLATIRQCEAFLGVEPDDLPETDVTPANRLGDVTARRRIIDVLRRLRRKPGIAQIADLCGADTRQQVLDRLSRAAARSFIGQRIVEVHKRRLSPLTPETRQHLLDRFEEPTRELEMFLDRKLPGWFE